MARGKRGEFLMANGRAAAVEPHDALAGERFLAIGEIVGRAASARILTAAPLTREEIEAVAGASITTTDELTFDRDAAALRARRRRRLGALILAEQTSSVPADEASALALASGVLSLGVARLPWTKSLKQWRDRVLFLRRAEEGVWPDLSDEALAASPDWLAPFLLGKTEPRRHRRGRSRSRRCTRSSTLRSFAPARERGADAFRRADRHGGGSRLRSRGRPEHRAARAGAVRPFDPSRARGRTRAADAASAVARASADPDHARLARASGTAPGWPCARTCAAATPDISGPRTPPPPRPRRGRSRERILRRARGEASHFCRRALVTSGRGVNSPTLEALAGRGPRHGRIWPFSRLDKIPLSAIVLKN